MLLVIEARRWSERDICLDHIAKGHSDDCILICWYWLGTPYSLLFLNISCVVVPVIMSNRSTWQSKVSSQGKSYEMPPWCDLLNLNKLGYVLSILVYCFEWKAEMGNKVAITLQILFMCENGWHFMKPYDVFLTLLLYKIWSQEVLSLAVLSCLPVIKLWAGVWKIPLNVSIAQSWSCRYMWTFSFSSLWS